MQATLSDVAALKLALQWANKGLYTTMPNPRVGCVIVANNQVIGTGFTQPAGFDHAEVNALKDAKNRGNNVKGATAYVTLEPCSHFGKTPPCADALIAAGIKRVVIAMTDPNPLVAGQGIKKLQQAGIEVTLPPFDEPHIQAAAYELNRGFFTRMQTGKPWVRMKSAASLDGKTALNNNQSQWITGQAARDDGHHWRARACAIVCGIGTILEDDPQLTVRAFDVPRQPTRIIVDSKLQTPVNAKALKGGALIVYAQPNPKQHDLLTQAGAECLFLPNAQGKVDLSALMLECGKRQFNELHIEAGSKLNGSLIRENCVDELLLYLAPTLLGPGRGMFELPEIEHVSQKTPMQFHEVTQLGEDIRILARFNKN